MFQDSPTEGVRATSESARTVYAFQVFFALHSLGFLALMVQEGAQHPAHTLADSLGLWSGGSAATSPWQLLTYAFLHQQPLEVGFSVALLLTLGAQLERTLGTLRFSVFYLGSIAGVGLLATGWDALWGEARLAGNETLFLGALGASGALVAAYALAHPTRRTLGLMPAPAFFCAVAFFVVYAIDFLHHEPSRKLVELLQSNLTAEQWQEKQLEQGAHPLVVLPQAFGFLVGPAAFAVDSLATHALARARVRRGIRHLEEHLEARARVDQLLEKISREGIEALSRRERKFLQYASRFYPNGDRVTSEGPKGPAK